jgi:hypothetical protein
MTIPFQFVNNTELALTCKRLVKTFGWTWGNKPPETIQPFQTIGFSIDIQTTDEVLGTFFFLNEDQPLTEVVFTEYLDEIRVDMNSSKGYYGTSNNMLATLKTIELQLSEDNRNWMENMADKISQKPLRTICLPGTHDSATYKITPKSKVSPDAPADLYGIEHIIKGSFLSPLLKYIVANWAVSQPQTITQQLNSGIRYFDLRLWWDGSEIYLVHSMTSVKYSDLINEIQTFVQENPKEILLLDFNQFIGFNVNDSGENSPTKVNASAATVFIDGLKELNDYLVPEKKGVDVTLNELWEEKKSIIAFNSGPYTFSSSLNIWPKDKIQSKWKNKQSPSELKNALEGVIANKPSDQFWVLQSILTPNPETIIEGILPGKSHNLKELALTVNPHVHNWLQNDWKDSGLNIVIVDWAMSFPYLSVIKKINEGSNP